MAFLVIAFVGKITSAAGQKGPAVVEAAAIRPGFRDITHVPLTEGSRPVAGRPHGVGDGPFTSVDTFEIGEGVTLKTEALLVLAGQQAGPGRRANGGADVGVGEDHTVPGQTVEIGRLEIFATHKSKISVAGVVDQKNNNIRHVNGRFSGIATTGDKKQQKKV